MAVVKDSAYFIDKLQTSLRARLPGILFFLYDPLSAFVEAVGKRAAEIVWLQLQNNNDYYADSARGAKLERRLVNEGIPKILARPSSDGTITLTRQTESPTLTTFPIGGLVFTLPPDPTKPTISQPTWTNTAAVTIGPGLGTSWTTPAIASRGGTDTNLLPGTRMLLATQANLIDGVTVGTAFTNGTDDETDDAYLRRGKFVMASRARGTDEALVAAALAAGAYYAYTVEQAVVGAPLVILYAADANGTLSPALKTEILRQLNGDKTTSPILPAARCKGIVVDVQAVAVVTFNFSIKLVLQAWVVDGLAGNLLTNLRADILTGVTNYIKSLNDPVSPDRVMRINAIKAICRSFKDRGVIDVDDATFLPAANSALLTAQQMAKMGVLTWL